MKKFLFLSALLFLSSCGKSDEPIDSTQPLASTKPWDTNITVENVKIGDQESSTKLAIEWTASTENVDHYRVVYIENSSNKEKSVESSANAIILEKLKAGTDYVISIQACLDAGCTNVLESSSATGKTSEEYWQIQGEGNSYAEANHVVADGETLAAISKLEGDELKMYYNPGVASNGKPKTPEDFAKQWKGMRVAISDDNSYKTFTAIDSGIKNVCSEAAPAPQGGQQGGTKVNLMSESSCPDGGLMVKATQAIPIKTKTEEFVRLFFEAAESDGDKATNNYYLDSFDGLIGEDFNPSKSSTICGEDGSGVAIGGECEPTIVIDKTDGLKNSRQAKIALPLLESQYWDMEAGTFMIITGEDTCSATKDGLFYAQWDGNDWAVEADDSCPTPLALKGHGPVLLHLGEDSYKLYYEMYNSANDRSKKPLKMFYTGGNNFEDFESYENARDVHFLWPNGEELSDQQESGLGDHFIYMPTLNLDTQYMVMNLGGLDDDSPQEPSTGAGLAILINP